MATSVTMKVYQVGLRQTLFPLALMIVTVLSAVVLPYIIVQKNSYTRIVVEEGLTRVVSNAWAAVNWRDREVICIIAGSAVWATLSLLLPGSTYFGPPTLSGFRPEYKKSGFLFYLISMSALITVVWNTSVVHLYPKFVTFGGMLSITGLILSAFVFVKGHLFPSPGVFGSSGNPVFDFYWGIELYPRLGPFNIFDFKTIVNCRFGLWLWQAVVIWAWKANYELHAAGYARGEINYPLTATTILQTIYLAKFFYWEDGYMSTIDISVDKFGFYEGWGCVAWVPTFYTLTSLYLIKHSPVHAFGLWSFVATLIVGIGMIWLNYETDRQRFVFRKTGGKCTIWGRPVKAIHAVYQSDDGHSKQSMLLASGLWGMARHFNYVFELGAAFAWSLPALTSSVIPYMYFCFLLVLLVHRSFRDEEKCRLKYTKYWDKYCVAVPYRILPYVY